MGPRWPLGFWTRARRSNEGRLCKSLPSLLRWLTRWGLLATSGSPKSNMRSPKFSATLDRGGISERRGRWSTFAVSLNPSQHHLPSWNLEGSHAILLRSSQAVSQRRLAMVLQETENKQQGAWMSLVWLSDSLCARFCKTRLIAVHSTHWQCTGWDRPSFSSSYLL